MKEIYILDFLGNILWNVSGNVFFFQWLDVEYIATYACQLDL